MLTIESMWRGLEREMGRQIPYIVTCSSNYSLRVVICLVSLEDDFKEWVCSFFLLFWGKPSTDPLLHVWVLAATSRLFSAHELSSQYPALQLGLRHNAKFSQTPFRKTRPYHGLLPLAWEHILSFSKIPSIE